MKHGHPTTPAAVPKDEKESPAAVVGSAAEAEAVAKEADEAETRPSSCVGATPKMPSRVSSNRWATGGGTDAMPKMTLAKEADEAEKELDAAEEGVKKKDGADKEQQAKKVKTLAEAEDRVKAAELNLAGCKKELMDAQADLDRWETQQAAVPGMAATEGAAALYPSPSRPPRAPGHEPRPPATAPTVHEVVRMASSALREAGHNGIARFLETAMADYQ